MKTYLAVVFAFFKLGFGLSVPFWPPDQLQTYLISAFLFQAAYAVNGARAYSLKTHRDLLVKAIDEKNYHLIGERRPLSYY